MQKKIANVILDLDETIVSSVPFDEFPANDVNALQKFLNGKRVHTINDEYIVFERPNLQKFLTYVFKHFNVSVWSAGNKEYVAYIVENVILGNYKNRQLDVVLWDKHCNDSRKHYKNLKDLRLLSDVYKLGLTKKDTVLIDDLASNCKHQQKNCLNILPFDITNTKNDNELVKVIKAMQKHLKRAESKK